jgi:pimeloyl-ACP methyl ester carboxylesterase
MWLWLTVALTVLASLVAWIIVIEVPRMALLLEDIRTQQHARFKPNAGTATATLNGNGKAAVTSIADIYSPTSLAAADEQAHAAGVTFHVRPLALTVTYEDEATGVEKRNTGVAEVLTLRAWGNGSSAWRERGPQDPPDTRPVFLMIPGNPGLVAFYRVFLLYLHRLTNGQVDLRCVSFVGHTANARLNDGRPFSFPAQLAYMRALLRGTLRETAQQQRRIFLAGHSVGAYTVLHMLDSLRTSTTLSESDRARVCKAFMLFPTVMDIAATPNGRVHTPALKWLRPVALGIVGMASLLPRSLQRFLLYRAVGLHPYEVEGAQGLLQFRTAAACMLMAHEEMCTIGPLDMERFVRPHMDKLHWVWGQTDAWAPLSQLQRLKDHFGYDLSYELAPKDAKHAFVVGGSHLVAPVIAEQIMPFLQQQLQQEATKSSSSRNGRRAR